MITQLPTDILILLFEHLTPNQLAALAQSCSLLNTAVNDFGWSSYLRIQNRPALSLSRARKHWSLRYRAQYDYLTDNAWQSNDFIARPLSTPWDGKLSPLLAISTNRLVVAAGTKIYSYLFGTPTSDVSPPLIFESVFSLLDGHKHPGDITAISLAHSDDDYSDSFIVAFHDGIIERVNISSSGSIARQIISTTSDNDYSESLSSTSQFLLSLSSNGSASISNHRNTSSALSCSSTIDLRARGWSSLLSFSSSTPYATFGTSQTESPLSVYLVPDAQFLSQTPSIRLSTGSTTNSSSAVYGLSQAPPSSPWGSSPNIIVSGWYDGKVRIYDIRLPSSSSSYYSSSYNDTSSSTQTQTQTQTLNPVLSLTNPWSYEPIYSISCGGGSNSHITAGSARHSVLSFWDIRSPKMGWSVHAPGNDPSPVYDVILESSRCFGVTQSRPFVYDFGPNVSIDTYPQLMQRRGDKLKPRKKLGFYVTKYSHSRGIAVNDH